MDVLGSDLQGSECCTVTERIYHFKISQSFFFSFLLFSTQEHSFCRWSSSEPCTTNSDSFVFPYSFPFTCVFVFSCVLRSGLGPLREPVTMTGHAGSFLITDAGFLSVPFTVLLFFLIFKLFWLSSSCVFPLKFSSAC